MSIVEKIAAGLATMLQAVFDSAIANYRPLIMLTTVGVVLYNQWLYASERGLFTRLDDTFTPQQLVLGSSAFVAVAVPYIILHAWSSADKNTRSGTVNSVLKWLALGVAFSVASILILSRVISHASRSLRDQTPYGRALSMAKTVVYGLVAFYAVYKIASMLGLFKTMKNPILRFIVLSIIRIRNDVREFYRIGAPVRNTILAVLAATAVYAALPVVKRFLNRTETRVLAKYLDLKREHVLSTFETLHPNFENTLRSAMRATTRAVREARDEVRGTLDDAMGTVTERASSNSEFDIVEQPEGMRYSYAIRFKLFLHQPGSYTSRNADRRLFSYGDKPLFQYNTSTQTLTISVRGADGELAEIYRTQDVRYQRWNEFTVNFVDGRVDVLEDGKLIATSADVVPYSSKDSIVIGEAEGVEGGISNVVYSLEPYAGGGGALPLTP
jgi:hypothetical protein